MRIVNAYLSHCIQQVHSAVSQLVDLEIEPVDLTWVLDQLLSGSVREHVVRSVQLLLVENACHWLSCHNSSLN